MKKLRLSMVYITLAAFLLLLFFKAAKETETVKETETAKKTGTMEESGREEGAFGPPLVYVSGMELDYATQFAADYYEGGYTLLTIADGSRFLVVPEGRAVPEELDGDIRVIKQPVENIYLAATAVMDMICALDALDTVALSGTKEEGWHIGEARAAMAAGKIEYAGRYNAPDYEKILDKGCGLAIESTMLSLHSPEVMEELIRVGVPVLVDYSSYERHPLGRTEWVKLYGALLGREEEALAAFERQRALLERAAGAGSAGKTVAFFYLSSNGTVNVRKSGDYVPRMIALAGGRYIFPETGDEENASSTVKIQMEEFYAAAKDADYLIYNSTVDGGVKSLEELLAKNALLKDFKAVKEGHVYCAAQNLYQASMELGTVIMDIHTMLTAEEKDERFQYLYRLE